MSECLIRKTVTKLNDDEITTEIISKNEILIEIITMDEHYNSIVLNLRQSIQLRNNLNEIIKELK